jgi:mannose-6-phosphate isomerase-like protein (cupin superfamily)
MRILLIAAAGAGLAGTALAQPAGVGIYVPAAKLTAMVAKTKDGSVSAPVPTGPGTTLITAHRDADGQVEVHTRLNDQIVVRSGQATFVVGGKVEGNKETAPGEWRGGKITGGHAYAMGPGDVLWIPAGAPHQVVSPKGDFYYLAFKFEAQPKR